MPLDFKDFEGLCGIIRQLMDLGANLWINFNPHINHYKQYHMEESVIQNHPT